MAMAFVFQSNSPLAGHFLESKALACIKVVNKFLISFCFQMQLLFHLLNCS